MRAHKTSLEKTEVWDHGMKMFTVRCECGWTLPEYDGVHFANIAAKVHERRPLAPEYMFGYRAIAAKG